VDELRADKQGRYVDVSSSPITIFLIVMSLFLVSAMKKKAERETAEAEADARA
jgi:hypothetical protein